MSVSSKQHWLFLPLFNATILSTFPWLVFLGVGGAKLCSIPTVVGFLRDLTLIRAQVSTPEISFKGLEL